jgi:hypothetical protein
VYPLRTCLTMAVTVETSGINDEFMAGVRTGAGLG